MTKSAVRALVISRLHLASDAVCYDVGAGTGSVSVEMALHAWRGQVFAVDKREESLPVIRENCRRFHIGNITFRCGAAPLAFDGLPPPSAAFIGGSDGNLDEIVHALKAKNPTMRIVIAAVTVETAAAALKALPNGEIMWAQVAVGKKAGNSHIFTAQNPVMLVASD
jgi:precorrin-6Y C5,15-methyltransferase (decarboxylating)